MRPCLRTRNPRPPLSVIPPIPTEPASPKPVASPCAPAAAVYALAVRPVSAHAVRRSRVDLQRAQVGEVEHDAAVADAVSRRAVAAAAHGQLEAPLAGVRDDTRGVRRVGDPGDHGGAAVDRA